jgi:hypothetical protein
VSGDVAGLPRADWVILAGLLLVIAWALWYASRPPRRKDDDG